MKCTICGKPMKSVSLAQNPTFHYTPDGRLKDLTGEHLPCQIKRYFRKVFKKVC